MRFRKLLSLTLVSSMALSQLAFPNAHSLEIKAQKTQNSSYSMNQASIKATMTTTSTTVGTPTPTPVTTQIPTVTASTTTPTSAFQTTSAQEATLCLTPVTPTNYHPYTYVNRFHFRWHDFCYNAAESPTLIIDGNFNGLDKIYYKGRKLTQNVDYRKELNYLIFTENFLKTIPEGKHELDAFGYESDLNDMYKDTITITKYNYKLNDTYQRKYPAAETSNFYSTMDCNRNNQSAWFWIKDISKLELVFLDGTEVRQAKNGELSYDAPFYRIIPTTKTGEGILRLWSSTLTTKSQKIHYIEVVSNGKSDVLKSACGQEYDKMDQLFEMYGTKLEDHPTSTPEAGSIAKHTEYMTGFWINKTNVYNTAQNGSFYVKGSFDGLNDIYYQNERLVPNKDYFVGDQVIEFSDDFLDALSDGENELTVYADYSEAEQNRSSIVSIQKINEPVKINDKLHYESADATNILNPLEVCTKDSAYILFGMKSPKQYDYVYIDYERYDYLDSAILHTVDDVKRGITFMQISNRNFEGLAVGVHTVEFVSDGHSDVAFLVIYDEVHSPEEVIKDGRKDIKFELPEDIKPISTTPAYEEDGYYMSDTGFWVYKNNVFNAAVSDDLIIPGRFVGFINMCYDGKALTKDDLKYGDEFLKLEASFLETLPYGRNEFTVYADHNSYGGIASYKIYVDKVDVPMENAYVSEYPLNEKNNFYGTFAIADDFTNEVIYGMKSYKEIEKVMIDHKEVPHAGINSPYDENYRTLDKSSKITPSISASFRLSNEVTYALSAGIHYVEVVSDGHSEVLYLLRVDGGHFADTLLTTEQEEWNGKVDCQVTTCKQTNSISQSYSLKQVDNNEAFDLSKVTIKYFYHREGEKEQKFNCDHAGIQLNQAPYYESFVKHVKGTFGNGYVETNFTDSYELADNTIHIQIRFHQIDWSDYVDFEEGHVEVYYDGKLVYSEK